MGNTLTLKRISPQYHSKVGEYVLTNSYPILLEEILFDHVDGIGLK